MLPVEAVTLRTRWLTVSAMYTLPELSAATPAGKPRPALVAGPPSPLVEKMEPLPATMLMVPWANAAAEDRDRQSKNAKSGFIGPPTLACKYTRKRGDALCPRTDTRASWVGSSPTRKLAQESSVKTGYR